VPHWNNGLVRMTPYVTNSVTASSYPGHISFVSGSSNWEIQTTETFNSRLADYGQTVPGSGANQYVIQYNMYHLDGSYYPIGDNRNTDFCPLEWRSHAQCTSNHEFGHALLLNHNTLQQDALMWATIDTRYFTWHTDLLRTPDWNTLLAPGNY
jgi:hypothetical protein